jgi:hypothetical protein
VGYRDIEKEIKRPIVRGIEREIQRQQSTRRRLKDSNTVR